MAVTTSPQFLVRNVIKDVSDRAFGSTEGKFKIPKDTRKAKKEYLLGGGGQFGFFAKNRGDYEAILKQAIKETAADKKNIFLKSSLFIPNKAAQAYKYLRENSETFTRELEYQSVYEKMKEMGLSDYDAKLEAMAAGRRLMDFKVKGTYAAVVNQILPFFNPSIQGTRRFVTRVKNNPAKVATRMLVYGGILELAQAAIIQQQDDSKKEEYFGLTPYRKLLFYNIPIGDYWLCIPKGFSFGMLTSSIGRVLDNVWLGDENALSSDNFTKQIGLLNPINPQIITGTQNVMTGIAYNYDAFRDKQIIPQYETDKDVELRSGTKNASQLAKLISSLSNTVISNSSDPRMVDFFIKGVLSYWGDMITQTSNIGSAGKTPTSAMTGFVKPQSVFSDKNVQWVFDKAKRFEQTSDVDYKVLIEKIKSYGASDDKEIKRSLLVDIIKDAKNIKNDWEEIDLLEKRKQQKSEKSQQSSNSKKFGKKDSGTSKKFDKK
jgi:hypothetical protein